MYKIEKKGYGFKLTFGESIEIGETKPRRGARMDNCHRR